MLYSNNRFTGDAVYVATFYERLGLNFSALVEGREPTLPEIVHFVHPPVAAVGGAASAAAGGAFMPVVGGATTLAAQDAAARIAMFNLHEISSLYEFSDAAQKVAGMAGFKAVDLGLKARELRRVMSADAAEVREAEAAVAAQEALCNTLKRIYDETLLLIADHMPSIAVPSEGAVVAPIDPSFKDDIGPDGAPTCAPRMRY